MVVLLRPQLGDDHLGAVLGRVVLRLADYWDDEGRVRCHLPKVEGDAQPLRVAGAGGPDRGSVAEPGCRDVEPHAEQAELAVPLVAAPPGAECQVEPVQIHASAGVGDPHLRVSWRAVPPGQRDRDFRGGPGFRRGGEEVVERVVDEFGEALPGGELDVAEHGEEPWMWTHVDGLAGRRWSHGLGQLGPLAPVEVVAPTIPARVVPRGMFLCTCRMLPDGSDSFRRSGAGVRQAER